MPASPAARSSSTLTAAAPPMAAGRFPGKDPAKWSAPAPLGRADHRPTRSAYAIGVPKPLSFYVNTGGACDEAKLARVLNELMDLSPRGIRTHLGLNKPIYTPTSSYGHFGREPEASGAFSWERTDLADELRRAF